MTVPTCKYTQETNKLKDDYRFEICFVQLIRFRFDTLCHTFFVNNKFVKSLCLKVLLTL